MSAPASDAETPQAAVEPEAETVGKFPRPVTHGVGITGHLCAPALYEAVRDRWFSVVGRPENEPDDGVPVAEYDPSYLPDGEYVLTLKSKGWKAGREQDGDYQQFFEYVLLLRRQTGDGLKKPPISLNVTVEPYLSGMVYSDGNDLALPFGPGTGVKIQTTYSNSPEDVTARALDALAAVFGENVPDDLADVLDVPDDPDPTEVFVPASARILKAEAHSRFEQDKTDAVVEAVERSKALVRSTSRAYEASQRRRDGNLAADIRTNGWDVLGFNDVDYREYLKVYHTGDAHHRDDADPLAHPKLEAAYSGGGADGSGGAHPHVTEWDTVLDGLRRKVAQHALWAGLGPGDLVADDHFRGPSAPLYRFDTSATEGRREDLRAMYNDLRAPILQEAGKEGGESAAHDVLDVVLQSGGATYDHLAERTGLSRSAIRYHVRRFAELGFVARVGNPVVVVFQADYVFDLAGEVMDSLHAGETVGDRMDELAERAQARRERREGGDGPENGSDGEGGEDVNTGRSRSFWRYVEDVGITPDALALLLNQDRLGGRDVRVRTDALDEDGDDGDDGDHPPPD